MEMFKIPSNLTRKNTIEAIVINFIMAALYIIGIQFSHQFTTLQSDIASIWIPSAITLWMIFIHGTKIFYGITVGSIIGLIPSLNSLQPPLSLLGFIFLQISCAVANCLQPYISYALIVKIASNQGIFDDLKSIWIFIVASFFSPLISALIGVSSLLWLGYISMENYNISFINWWLASSLAHILFTPTLLLWKKTEMKNFKATLLEIIFILLSLILICFALFKWAYSLEYFLLAILIWSVFRLPRFYSVLLVSVISLIAVICTSNGYGVFVKNSPSQSLLFLQSFIGVFSLTSLIMSALLMEKRITNHKLEKTLENLENTVLERTKELTETKDNLQQVNQTLEKMVNTDDLTKIANRRCFDYILTQQWEILAQLQQPLSLLMIDVDYFKPYNDTYGHQQGDECLILIAQAFQSITRKFDLVARYGGEEFAMLLPNTDTPEATIVAQKISNAIKKLNIPHKSSKIHDQVTISIGIASIIPDFKNTSKSLIETADKALYSAKQKGRNQFIVK
jgi:diguanylate cyclase (GGDEF)-like protein